MAHTSFCALFIDPNCSYTRQSLWMDLQVFNEFKFEACILMGDFNCIWGLMKRKMELIQTNLPLMSLICALTIQNFLLSQ